MTTTEAKITKIMNWVALAIAVFLALLVLIDLLKRDLFSGQGTDLSRYTFDDLPGQSQGPVLVAGVDKIIARHIFGEKPVAPTRAPEPVKRQAPPPREKLTVKVTGIIEGNSPDTGFAMVDEPGVRGTKLLAVGQKLGKADAVLKSVYPNRVVFDRNGYEETVEMPRLVLALNAPLPDELPEGTGEQFGLPGASDPLYFPEEEPTMGDNFSDFRGSATSTPLQFPTSRLRDPAMPPNVEGGMPMPSVLQK